jgi:hypothetical protein
LLSDIEGAGDEREKDCEGQASIDAAYSRHSQVERHHSYQIGSKKPDRCFALLIAPLSNRGAQADS